MERATLRRSVRETAGGGVLLCIAVALLVWPQQSMQAAQRGLALCAQTIVPSLFPFFVLSTMVLKLNLAQHLGCLLEGVMWPLFRVGGAGAAALVLGFVGGYPVGARTAEELYRDGLCSRAETERLLAFCNNSGPAFVLGVVGVGVFGSGRAGLVLYGAHVVASICVGLLFRFYKQADCGERTCAPKRGETVRGFGVFVDSVQAALTAVLNVCAFVVVFAVAIGLLEQSGILQGAARALARVGLEYAQTKQLLCGLLEVSSGVSGLQGEEGLALAAFMLGWAGLSVHCQVLSFLADSGLRVRTYLFGKALHGVVSYGLIKGFVQLFPTALPASGWLGQRVGKGVNIGFFGVLVVSVSMAWLLWSLLRAITAAERNAKKRVEK